MSDNHPIQKKKKTDDYLFVILILIALLLSGAAIVHMVSDQQVNMIQFTGGSVAGADSEEYTANLDLSHGYATIEI